MQVWRAEKLAAEDQLEGASEEDPEEVMRLEREVVRLNAEQKKLAGQVRALSLSLSLPLPLSLPLTLSLSPALSWAAFSASSAWLGLTD